MKIQVKVAGTLEDYLPPGRSNPGDLEVSAGSTPVDVARQLRLPTTARYLISVNGNVVPHSEHTTRVLNEDDSVSIMSPLKGG